MNIRKLHDLLQEQMLREDYNPEAEILVETEDGTLADFTLADIETTTDLQPVAAGQTLNVVISGCFTTNALDGYGINPSK